MNHGLSCQVYDDSRLIGRVRIEKTLTCDKFLAMTLGDAKEAEDCRTRKFDTIFDALDWLERCSER
ncbi:MAG TPA: hypothetical protein PLV78_15495 [Deltaproteobacteria bacterium]|nr:hypothetical protein [Deltaproteobacteria bacterium]